MEIISKNWLKVVSLGTLALLVTIPFVKFNTVSAQSQSGPPCCVDRWDPDWTERDMWEPGRMDPGHRQRMARHWAFMHGAIPSEYRGQFNPLASTPGVVEEGGKLYQKHCSLCHGANGMGNREAAHNLSPSPALLAYMVQMPMSVDEYLLWSISEGGERFNTAMPAFKGRLSEKDIWRIISFMRAGFPAFARN